MRHGFPWIVIGLCFAAIFLACYAPALFMDRQFGYRDAGNYYYPLNKRVQAEWNAGRWPLWEPEENAGMPLLGNPTAAVFYPGKLVFAALPYAWAARTYVVLHSALAFVSMLVLMRSWGVSAYGSALSALSYAFCAPILFQTCNIIYLIGAAWLPLGIHAVDGWVRLGRRWSLLELALVLSMQVLAGELQAAYLLGVAGLGYAAGLVWSRSRRPGVRGAFFALAVMWLGLAGSAALAVALTAAQLFPVIEYTQQTGRANAGPDEVFNYPIDPCQLTELVWPNFLGAPFGRNDYWRSLVPAPGLQHSVWVPSLYLGGLTLVLALGSVGVRHGPAWRIWMSVLAMITVLGSLGTYTSPIWLSRSLARTAPFRSWLPDLGPLDPADSTPVRPDGRVRDSTGSAYWWLSVVLPGFRQFRYPAKLFTFAALALSALAGFGWDDSAARRTRRVSAAFATFVVFTAIALTVVVFWREPIVSALRGLESPSFFGPFEPLVAYSTIIASLGQALIVLAVGFVLTTAARKFPHWAGSAAILLLTADLTAANARYVITVPQASFEAQSKVLEVIAEAERADPSPGPFRIYRMWQWYPMSWFEGSSPDRINDVLRWDRDTLYPKFGLDFGLEYTHTGGVGQLADYERFFTRFYTKVVDPLAARHLGVERGAQIIYYPRRAFDLWNTRYMIVAFAPNGWCDPPRAHASFLFGSREVYPDPGQFQGADGAEKSVSWAQSFDFKVIRNLATYPRSWVVHGARVARPIGTAAPDAQRDTVREILYAADPLWNYAGQRVYDPQNLAWVSKADLNGIRRYLSGMQVIPSETVRVTYPSPQETVLEVNLESPGLVILADVYYPGWQLTIDEIPAPIYRVNGAMRGAGVSAGHHRLVYTFRPLSVRLGAFVSIAGLATLGVLCLLCARSPLDPLLAGTRPVHSETTT